jgi:hypothetical protein
MSYNAYRQLSVGLESEDFKVNAIINTFDGSFVGLEGQVDISGAPGDLKVVSNEADLEALSGSALVNLYNGLRQLEGEQGIVKFRNKEVGRRVTFAALANKVQCQSIQTGVIPDPTVTVPKEEIMSQPNTAEAVSQVESASAESAPTAPKGRRSSGLKEALREMFAVPGTTLTKEEVLAKVPAGIQWSAVTTALSDFKNPKYWGKAGPLVVVREGGNYVRKG